MVKFREKKNGNVWHIQNEEHIKHFRSNPRFEEIKETKLVSKKVNKNKKYEVIENDIKSK